MIIGLQAAILCSRFEQRHDEGACYIGVRNGGVLGYAKPSIVPVTIAMHVVLDGRASRGLATVSVSDWEEPFPFEVPEGLEIASLILSLLIPVLRKGELKVSIENGDRPGRPFRVRWGVDFAENAPASDAFTEADILDAAREIAFQTRQSIISAGRMN